jgi:hypothetical protein
MIDGGLSLLVAVVVGIGVLSLLVQGVAGLFHDGG